MRIYKSFFRFEKCRKACKYRLYRLMRTYKEIVKNYILILCTFYTKYGEELSFVVTRSQKNEWIRQITEAVTSLARSRISFPANIPEEDKENISAQIKVIQCQGCGAFVITTAGNAAKCDYCGRPTVG